MQAITKRHYLIAAACFLIQAVGVGIFVTYGVFFNSLLDEFQWPRAVISGASSLAFFLSGLFAIFVGRLNDIYGPRRLVGSAAILFGTGLILTSFVSEIWHLYLFYGIIFGIGLSAIDVIALTTTARWFSQSRGMMTGIVKVGTGAGQFVIPFTASILIIAYGWRHTYVIIGVFALVALFLLAQILRRDPADIDISGRLDRKRPTAVSTKECSGLTAREAIRTVQMWLICSVTVLIEFCLLTVLVHIVPHASDVGLSNTQAAGTLSTIGAVSMVGRFASGVAIDSIGSKAIMVVCFGVLIISLLWLQIADALWMLYLFAAVYGLAHGSFFTAISPIVAETFGILSHGAIFGIVVFSGTLGGSVGPILAGQIFDMTGSYEIVFWIITVMSVISLGLILLLKPIGKAVIFKNT